MKNNINHPQHYNSYPIETIDMMIAVFGKEQTATFCLLNAFKYRMRLGLKDNIEQDLGKEKWYLDKYMELKDDNNDIKNIRNIKRINMEYKKHYEKYGI